MKHKQIIDAVFNRANELGITDYRIAEKTGLHQSTISRARDGAEVRLNTVLLIAKAVNCKLIVDYSTTEKLIRNK